MVAFIHKSWPFSSLQKTIIPTLEHSAICHWGVLMPSGEQFKCLGRRIPCPQALLRVSIWINVFSLWGNQSSFTEIKARDVFQRAEGNKYRAVEWDLAKDKMGHRFHIKPYHWETIQSWQAPLLLWASVTSPVNWGFMIPIHSAGISYLAYTYFSENWLENL